MIKSFIKNLVKQSFQKVGLEIRQLSLPAEPIPVSSSIDEAFSRSLSGSPCSFNCEMPRIRTLHGFSLGHVGWHPFHAALSRLKKDIKISDYKDSFLAEYYKTWKPVNAHHAYLAFTDAPADLTQFPAFAIHNPWMDANPHQRHQSMVNIIITENTALGFPEISEDEGYGLHGPVSEAKGRLEFERLLSTYRSIKSNGYLRNGSHSDITGVGIKRGNDYRVVIAHGQHRAAVLSFLEYSHIPIKLNKLLDKDEVSHWPQVVNGHWTRVQAEKYVDYLFDYDANIWAASYGLKH